jgi:hypothetical protein
MSVLILPVTVTLWVIMGAVKVALYAAEIAFRAVQMVLTDR